VLILSLSSQYKVITSPLGDGLHKDGKRLTPQRLKVLNLFENIGSKIGLLFQIADDLIDLKSNSKEAGKKTGKDQKKGKATLINLIGLDDSVKYCDKIIKDIN